LTQQGELSFLPVEAKRYPALKLAYDALKEGGTMPAALNASNEVAVAAFLERKIGFRDIHRVIDKTMQGHVPKHPKQVDEILEVDRWAREKALSLIH
jgi:1-deoxy-D-xylulose-5-phosphate reductoisomerase